MNTVGDDCGKWSFRGGWRRPWLDGGGRCRRQLPRRMEAAMVDGTAPSSDGGDSGRATAADGVARGGQRRPRRGGRGGRRLRRRKEATVADGDDDEGMEPGP